MSIQPCNSQRIRNDKTLAIQMTTIVTHGTDEFSQHAEAWDFLWAASGDSHPFCRSNSLASAIRQLFPKAELKVLFVFDSNGEPMAALPLVKRTIKGVPILELPNNEWGVWGDLLVNPANESEQCYHAVAKGIDSIKHFALRLNLVNADSHQWHPLLEQLESSGKNIIRRDAFQVGMIEHDTSWTTFRSRLSKGLKTKLAKFRRRLDQSGQVSFEVKRQFEFNEIESVMNRVFEVENRSWKGSKQTTTKDHDLVHFFIEQAHCLNEHQSLCVSFLKLDDVDIAFEFGMLANRIYYSFKIGFDSNYDNCSPGHLLSEFLTEHFHASNACDAQDTMGPISQATSRWSSRSKQLCNVAVGGNIWGANSVLKCVYGLRGILARNKTHATVPKLGAKPPTIQTNNQSKCLA